MKWGISILWCFLILSSQFIQAQEEKQETASEDTRMVQKIFDEVLTHDEGYELLRDLCTSVGARLSGSKEAQKAVEWGKKVMEEYNFDKVYLQELMVPHWERGEAESCHIVGKENEPFTLLAIGGSVPTSAEGLTAEVIELNGLEEVKEMGEEKIKGKIVFFSRPIDQRLINTGAGYGGAVDQRVDGPSKAAEYGAVGVVIRSVTTLADDVPHTGTLSYDEEQPKIPAAALGYLSADRLQKALKENDKVEVFLKINSKWYEDAPSFNVIGEMTGSEKPDEIITVGGHLDSWDVGEGAHDDGAGCVQSISVLRTFQKLNYKPRHTIRAVLFMNEENGSRGGKKYAELAEKNKENHLIAIESDSGAFSPRGFGISSSDEVLERLRSWLPSFDKNTISYIEKGGGGVDIRPLHEALDVPMVGLIVDYQKVFDYHHSPHDLFKNVSKREMNVGTASLVSLIYLIDKNGLSD